MNLGYTFTELESRAAFEAWGCNCGPAALAFALRVKPDDVRGLIPGFDAKKYTSPTMMADALAASGASWRRDRPADGKSLFGLLSAACASLVRIQWTGPWTGPDANPKWAYRQTHWICGWVDDGVRMVFDVNGGIRTLGNWEQNIVPPLLEACVPNASGGWYPTHCWPVVPAARKAVTV